MENFKLCKRAVTKLSTLIEEKEIAILKLKSLRAELVELERHLYVGSLAEKFEDENQIGMFDAAH